MTMLTDSALRRTVLIVALLNLAYFGVEFAGALWSSSVSLFADSVDFLEDAAVNFLIFAALGWTAKQRSKVGMALAAIMLVPAAAFLWTLWRKFAAPVPPAAFAMSAVAMGALAVNLTCAFLLARHRGHHGSLTKAAFLSARNDALANVAVIVAALVTLFWVSIWPDIIVGLGIAWLNLDAAGEVWRAAREEKKLANA